MAKKFRNQGAKKKYGQSKLMGTAKVGDQVFLVYGTKWAGRVEIPAFKGASK